MLLNNRFYCFLSCISFVSATAPIWSNHNVSYSPPLQVPTYKHFVVFIHSALGSFSSKSKKGTSLINGTEILLELLNTLRSAELFDIIEKTYIASLGSKRDTDNLQIYMKQFSKVEVIIVSDNIELAEFPCLFAISEYSRRTDNSTGLCVGFLKKQKTIESIFRLNHE